MLQVPLINLHTTGDPIVPFNQAALYRNKVTTAGTSARLTSVDVDRSGHCTFESGELLGAFAMLWDEVNAQPVTAAALR